MWESPDALWRRLKLGREEYLQRLITTLIVGGDPRPWNTPCSPSSQGLRFLELLDELAHGTRDASATRPSFVDEYLLPRLEETAINGWPDWAVIWDHRVWIIELKTEKGSHRPEQLPYFLQLAAAAHPGRQLDLTYLTGPLSKPEPALLQSQRYRHLTWEEVLPLIERVWGADSPRAVLRYVETIREIIVNLKRLTPTGQREEIIDRLVSGASEGADTSDVDLLKIAKQTAEDGAQRGVCATDPTHLEELAKQARSLIDTLEPDGATRSVLPWLWQAGKSGGTALTDQGAEFGLELRFSRYGSIQVKPSEGHLA